MTDNSLTADEIKLYDRQIRLWGMEAQTRMRNSKVLLINLTSVGVEIAKNLMLGGIGSFYLIDNSVVQEQDLNANFFVDKNQIGVKKVEAASARIQELNNRVKFEYSTDSWESKGVDFFNNFNLVISTGLEKSQLIKLNEITRSLSIPLYASGSHGLYGYIFVDLIEHQSTIKSETPKKLGAVNSVSKIITTKESIENDNTVYNSILENTYRPFKDIFNSDKLKEFYPSLKKLKKVTPVLPVILALFDYEGLLNKPIEEVSLESNELKSKAIKLIQDLNLPSELLNDETISELSRQAFCEFQPVSAIIGGALSQDVINMLGKREAPINNFVVMDGYKNEMPIFTL